MSGPHLDPNVKLEMTTDGILIGSDFSFEYVNGTTLTAYVGGIRSIECISEPLNSEVETYVRLVEDQSRNSFTSSTRLKERMRTGRIHVITKESRHYFLFPEGKDGSRELKLLGNDKIVRGRVMRLRLGATFIFKAVARKGEEPREFDLGIVLRIDQYS